MPAKAVVGPLLDVGLVDSVIDRQLGAIHWPQARKMSYWRSLERMSQDRFAICVRRPVIMAAFLGAQVLPNEALTM